MKKRVVVECPDQLHFDFDVDEDVSIKVKEVFIDDSGSVILNRESYL